MGSVRGAKGEKMLSNIFLEIMKVMGYITCIACMLLVLVSASIALIDIISEAIQSLKYEMELKRKNKNV